MPISPPYRRRRRRQYDGPPPGQYPGTIAPTPPVRTPRAYHPAMPLMESLLGRGPELGPNALRSVGDRDRFPLSGPESHTPGAPVGGVPPPLGGGIPDSGASMARPPEFRKVVDDMGREILSPPASGVREYRRGHFQVAPPTADAPMHHATLGDSRRFVLDGAEKCHLCRRTPIPAGVHRPDGPDSGMCPRCGRPVCPDCEVKMALAGYTANSFPCPVQH